MNSSAFLPIAAFTAVLVALGGVVLAQKAPDAGVVDRGLFRITDGGLEEIYVFPLAGSETELVFATCPFVELPDGSGAEGTACRIEWVSGAKNIMLRSKAQDISGCAIEDHWNIECPDFTAEGFTFSNAQKLGGSVHGTLQALDEDAMPVKPAYVDPLGERDGQDVAYLGHHFEVFADCTAFAAMPNWVTACEQGFDAVTEDVAVLGVTALAAGPHMFVCMVTDGWGIPACNRVSQD